MITLLKNRDLDLFDYLFEPYRNEIWSPKTKIDQNDDEYALLISVPGLSKSDIKITTDNHELSVSFEKEEKTKSTYFVQNFKKSYTIPNEVIESDITAKVENGILEVTLPKGKKKITQRMIEIK